jgi:hypothetical protein
MAQDERTLRLNRTHSADNGGVQPSLIRFYQMIPSGRRPVRAEDTAAGTMPARAHRLCEAMRYASAFGWYLYPPLSFSVIWDGGSDMFWTYEGADAWHPISTTHFPGFPELFERAAPADLRPFVPPFLASLKDPGLLQIWTGFMARTACGWSALVRSPANLAHSKAYDYLEGVIRTDSWFGPLFTTIRVARTNVPIEFRAEHPLLQVQPVHRTLCYDQLDHYDVVPNMKGFSAEDWSAFRSSVLKPLNEPKSARKVSALARSRSKAIQLNSAYSSAVLGAAAPRFPQKGIDATAAKKRGPETPSP